ncbi:MAG: hypothetical protein Q8J99_03790 [Sulfuritalea sp.]|nr:hypothetical protein [Sulfuritalea sp.]
MLSLTLLPLLAVAALAALVTAGLLLMLGEGTPQLAAHVAFALGVMPLILAAMGYFVPVLTRSAAPGFAAWGPQLLGWGGGAVAVLAFATDFSPLTLGIAALTAALGALILGGWTLNRAKRMFGPRHRGLDWYLAALGFLVLALLAVILMPWFPAARNGLRLFHLHANLLGFVGLTALGTLQVLLPTCIGKPDPEAALRLRHDLKWAASGALLIAVGVSSLLPQFVAAAGLPLALVGAALYGFVIARMLRAWISRFGGILLQLHGAASSLAAAALGLLVLLILGAAHGFGWPAARPAVAGFVIAFLLPLVSGAAAHLLPVWLRPGVQGAWHQSLRAWLCRWSGMRGLVLLLCGLAIALN